MVKNICCEESNMSNKQTAAMPDKMLDEKTAHTVFVC